MLRLGVLCTLIVTFLFLVDGAVVARTHKAHKAKHHAHHHHHHRHHRKHAQPHMPPYGVPGMMPPGFSFRQVPYGTPPMFAAGADRIQGLPHYGNKPFNAAGEPAADLVQGIYDLLSKNRDRTKAEEDQTNERLQAVAKAAKDNADHLNELKKRSEMLQRLQFCLENDVAAQKAAHDSTSPTTNAGMSLSDAPSASSGATAAGSQAPFESMRFTALRSDSAMLSHSQVPSAASQLLSLKSSQAEHAQTRDHARAARTAAAHKLRAMTLSLSRASEQKLAEQRESLMELVKQYHENVQQMDQREADLEKREALLQQRLVAAQITERDLQQLKQMQDKTEQALDEKIRAAQLATATMEQQRKLLEQARFVSAKQRLEADIAQSGASSATDDAHYHPSTAEFQDKQRFKEQQTQRADLGQEAAVTSQADRSGAPQRAAAGTTDASGKSTMSVTPSPPGAVHAKHHFYESAQHQRPLGEQQEGWVPAPANCPIKGAGMPRFRSSRGKTSHKKGTPSGPHTAGLPRFRSMRADAGHGDLHHTEEQPEQPHHEQQEQQEQQPHHDEEDEEDEMDETQTDEQILQRLRVQAQAAKQAKAAAAAAQPAPKYNVSFTGLPPTTLACPGSCAALPSCDVCTQNPSCGWCESSKSCVPVDKRTRTSPQCLPAQLSYLFCRSFGCEKHMSCRQCMSDGRCGLCASTGMCVAGAPTGPADGSFCHNWNYGNNTLRFLSLNIYGRDTSNNRQRVQNIFKMIQAADADFVALQEVEDWFLAEFQKTSWGKAYHTSDFGSGHAPGGLFLMSKVPLQGVAYYEKTMPGQVEVDERGRMLMAYPQMGMENFAIATTTLDWRDSANRAASLDFAFSVLNITSDVVLMGDFNFDAFAEPESSRVPSAYVDIWPHMHPSKPGFTWDPQNNKYASASDPQSQNSRVDRIFVKSDWWSPLSVDLVGGPDVSPHYGLMMDAKMFGAYC